MAVGLNEELYDKTVDRAVMIARYEQMLKNKVFVIVDDHTVRLDKLISSAKTSNAGYAALREAVDQELQRAYKQVYNVSKRSLLEMVHDQMSYTFQVMDAGLSKVWRTKPASRQIGEDIVLKRPLADDQTLAEGWARVSNSERQRIERIIRKGIADGLTAAELSKEIRKGRIHKITKQHADALVTTAVTSVQAQADQAVYAANEPALEGWQYVAILDSSTTPLCRFRHGHVYPTGDVKHLPPAHFRCYLDDTLVYTKSGFVPMKDVKVGDLCLSLDPETEDLSWQPVVKTFSKKVNKIRKITGKSLDLAVSLDHPFIGQKRVDRGSYKEWVPRKYESFEEVPKSDFRSFLSSKWTGERVSRFRYKSIDISIETYLAFMAWYLSDGSITKKSENYYNVAISQETHRELMLEVLAELNPRPWGKDKIGFVSQDLAEYVLQFGKSTEKFIPDFIKELSSELIYKFLEFYLLGDGCSTKGSDFGNYVSKPIRSFTTTSTRLRDGLAELVIKAGGSTTLSTEPPRIVHLKDGRVINGRHPVHKVSWNYSTYRTFASAKVEVVSGEFNVVDLELAEKHTLLVSRNGKTIWGSNCRSTTTPIVKRWDKLFELDNVMQIRKRNLQKLTPAQREYYDGLVPNQLRYDDWLRRQPLAIQLKHAGSQEALDAFHKGAITGSQLLNMQGKPIGIKALRQLTDSEFSVQGDTARFARAKLELDMLKLPVARPEDLLNDPKMQARLKEYYRLQSMELDGTLSLTNYRGITLGNKRATKRRVLTRPPTEEQMRFNPVTGRYEDVRLYQPAPQVLENNLRLVEEATELTKADKEFIQKFIKDMDQRIGVNELAVITDNLRIIFTRYRKNPEPWGNFKAVLQNQIKFDVMNVSDAIETVLRRDTDLLKKLKQANYIDPVLGATQLEELGDTFLDNIRKKNRWENRVAPKLAKEMMPLFDSAIPLKIKLRISDKELKFFYERFARRLALADTPDVDQLAIALGRDLYNAANYTGSRQEWHRVGMKILQSKNVSKLYELETFGVQKRRMKSRMSGAYFGPYFDTISYNIRIVDPRIQEYSKLTRKVEVGLRVAVTDPSKRLHFRTNRKTYFIKNKWGLYEDTRIPITSTSSFSEFPEEFIDKNLVDALTWAGQAEYRIDKDFYDFVDKLLNFEDDRGRAKYYNSLNEYRKYIASRGDSYERFKSMEWLRKTDRKFSNTPFIDHRARIYDRGFISPQSGETFNVRTSINSVNSGNLPMGQPLSQA